MEKDDRTLGEVEQEDRLMLDNIKRKSNRFEFYDRAQAYVFQRKCLDTALDLMGIHNSMQLHHKVLNRLFKTKGVRIEERQDYQVDQWLKGIYVYKTKDANGDHIDELAYFISNVKVFTPSVFDRDQSKRWAVLTNVPMTGKKQYTFISMVKG